MDKAEVNNSNFASQPFNNPYVAPFLGLGENEILTLNPVPEDTGIGEDQQNYMATPQGPRNMLMKLRADFPYLPILPIPNNVVTVALAANIAQDIEIPDGTIIGVFFGSGSYYVSAMGNAEIPVAATQEQSKSIYKPEGFAFYLANKRALSVISADAACVVTILLYSFTELPT